METLFAPAKVWLWLIVVILLMAVFTTPSGVLSQVGDEAQVAEGDQHTSIENPFTNNQPIWTDNNSIDSPQVVLFRKTFQASQALQNSELYIFADTRYEAWLDGQWLGRGPARFSKTRHEYDVLPIGALTQGEHLLAVLVQWAPNIRRAESTRPHLLAHLQGEGADQRQQVLVRTDATWQASESNAWRKDAALVHSWNLLGPTELLDFQQLPANWMKPDFLDSNWHNAVAVALQAGIRYFPRSIPPLVEVPFTLQVIDAGLLSPDRTMVQLEPYIDSAQFELQVMQNTTVTVEGLAEPTISMSIDKTQLEWTYADEKRPDVEHASIALAPGLHTLSLPQIPTTTGLAFAISNRDLVINAPPFVQSNHAGRRLLLAEPVTNPAVATFTSDSLSQSLDIQIEQTPAYLVLDLGRVVLGRLYAEISGTVGTVVDVGWDERLFPDTLRPLPHPGSLHPEWNQVDSWVLDGTERQLTTLDVRAGRYILLAAWGKAPITLRNLHVNEERYPVQPRGSFQSSNPRLNRIWQIGVDTAYISMQDAYADAWREHGQWWGDAYVVDHVNQVAFGDTLLLRRGLQFMSESFRGGQPLAFAPNGDGAQLVDYSMLWVQSIADYFRLTGDTQFVRELYPSIQEFLDFLDQRRNVETGLLELPKGHWSQTSLIDWAGSTSRFGQSTALNALYYKTLLDVATLAGAIEETSDSTALQQHAEELRSAINHELYQPAGHQYLASIVDGLPITPTTHAQAWPLALGVANKNEVTPIAAEMEKSFRLEIYGMFWGLEALANAHEIDAALQLIEQKYGHLIDLGATTWWEGWNSQASYKGALSHGWGSAPTWFLTTHILGIQKTSPTSWIVAPALTGVSWAQGAVPFGSSDLSVRWETHGCAYAEVTIQAPIGSSGTLLLPASVVTIRLNGETIFSEGIANPDYLPQRSEEGIKLLLSEGESQVEVTSNCSYLPLIMHH
ncbi:MAG: amylo-alpha-1,6-glucosidase [Caldilineaceae bacterium]